jgi:hypothetical protein
MYTHLPGQNCEVIPQKSNFLVLRQFGLGKLSDGVIFQITQSSSLIYDPFCAIKQQFFNRLSAYYLLIRRKKSICIPVLHVLKNLTSIN